MVRTVSWVMLAWLSTSACGGNSERHGDTGPEGGGTQSPTTDYPIDPAALEGCRSPGEPNCLECCVGTTEDGKCDYQSAISASNPSMIEHSYVTRTLKDGPCSESCSPCAQCSQLSEERLRNIEVRAECDCPNVVLGADPCGDYGSCGCYCVTLAGATKLCPPTE
jgi:hypothetical protein